MYFKVYKGETCYEIPNTDNEITFNLFFDHRSFQTSYSVLLLHKSRGENASWMPNKLLPIFTSLNSETVDKMEVLSDEGTVILGLPSMYVSYRITNSNPMNDSLTDLNNLPQERMEFSFQKAEDLASIMIAEG